MNPWQAYPSPRGYNKPEVASALQKSIRRGDVDQACYWAAELDLAGYANYAWKRLLVCATEDVSINERGLIADIKALHDIWLFVHDKNNVGNGRRPYMMAVILLARAKKNRAVDHAVNVHYFTPERLYEIPDWAIDKHTRRGRQMGKTSKDFFEVGAYCENVDDTVDDPWYETAKALKLCDPKAPDLKDVFAAESADRRAQRKADRDLSQLFTFDETDEEIP